jgi:hypothetical protein
MFSDLSGRTAEDRANPQVSVPSCRPVAFVELITTAALALSTAVAITAVSIGMARADMAGAVTQGNGAPYAVALFVGLLLSGMGGLTAILAANHGRHD